MSFTVKLLFLSVSTNLKIVYVWAWKARNSTIPQLTKIGFSFSDKQVANNVLSESSIEQCAGASTRKLSPLVMQSCSDSRISCLPFVVLWSDTTPFKWIQFVTVILAPKLDILRVPFSNNKSPVYVRHFFFLHTIYC